MKNGLKILTLAGFIFVGTMLHLSAKAYLFAQPLSNGFGTAGASTEGVLSQYPFTMFGTFSGITSITMTIQNTGSVESRYLELEAYDSGWGALCYQDSYATIPVGVNDVTFNFNCPSVNNTNLEYLYFYFSDGSDPSLSIAQQSGGSCLVPNYSQSSPSCPPTMKFAFNGSFFTPVAITSPPAWVNQFGLDYEIPVDGTCPENGTSTLIVSWPNALYTTEPVTCTDNLFSVSIPTRDLGTFTAVFTSLCYLPTDNPLCTASYTYTVSPDFYNWNFKVDYPVAEKDGVTYNLQTQNHSASSTFPFRYVYTVPTGTPLSTVDINVRQYSDNTFSVPLTGGVDATSTLAALTYGVPVPATEFEDSHIVVSTVPNYYKVTMWNNGVLRAWVLVVVNQDNSINGQVPTLPALNNNGANPCNMDWFGQSLCWLVLPSQSDMQDIISTEQQELSMVVPFSYLQQAVTYIQTLSVTTSTPSAIALVIPSALNNGATSTSDLPIFEATPDTAPVTNFMTNIKPYLIGAMWIYFVYFCITKITEHWKGK